MGLNGLLVPCLLNMAAIHGSSLRQAVHELFQSLKIKGIDLCKGMAADIFKNDDLFIFIIAFRDDGRSALISCFRRAAEEICPFMVYGLFECFVHKWTSL